GVREDLGDLRVERGAATLAHGRLTITPLVEPALADIQRPAGDRVRHPVLGPLGGDERGQAQRVASFTHRTTDRLRTSRSISSSAQRRRNRTSSSRSFALRPSASPRSTRSLATQLPNVPSLIPRSRATSAIGLPVSRTIRTAPARNSGSNLLLVSGMTSPHRRCLYGTGGCSELRQALQPGPFTDWVDEMASASSQLRRLLGLTEPDYR